MTVYVDDLSLGGPCEVLRAAGQALDREYKTGSPAILGIDCDEMTHIGLQITNAELGTDKDGNVIAYRRLFIHQNRYAEELVSRHPEVSVSDNQTNTSFPRGFFTRHKGPPD
eukprot:2862280-Amphidinium_carterae.1